MRRPAKLNEFVAHTAPIRCIALGRRSGQVFATGGEDCKVNVWALGKANALMSLSGHSSAVTACSFDEGEDFIVAGSEGGSLKVWDLQQAKTARSLPGHRTRISAVSFHPYGEFFASGSADTNLKVWDVRRKGCIHTYKGHSADILSIRFSPDGRWVVSAGRDGVARLWDLTAGRLLHEFDAHGGPVTSIDFHPNEFLMATGSSDRTVCVWDLENFSCIASSHPETAPVDAISFTPEGECLASVSQDGLRTWGWEPARCFDHVEWDLTGVRDARVNPDGRMVVCCAERSVVSVHVVNMKSLAPLSGEPGAPATPPALAVARPNAAEETPIVQAQATPPVRAPRTPVRAAPPQRAATPEQQHVVEEPSPAKPLPVSAPAAPSPAPRKPATPVRAAMMSPVRDEHRAEVPVNFSGQPTSSPALALHAEPPRSDGVIPSSFDRPQDLQPERFRSHREFRDENELLAALQEGSGKVEGVMSQRSANLAGAASLWASGNVKASFEAVARSGDLWALVDILQAAKASGTDKDILHIDIVTCTLPMLKLCLESGSEDAMRCGAWAATHMLRHFDSLIRETLKFRNEPGLKLEFAFEDRVRKCLSCYHDLVALRDAAEEARTKLACPDSAELVALVDALRDAKLV